MTMGATLVWPAVVVLGFLCLHRRWWWLSGPAPPPGTSSSATARGSPQRAATPRSGEPSRRAVARPPGPADAGSGAGPRRAGRAASPSAPRRPRSPRAAPPGGWSGESAQVLAGPFADRVDADWAAFADELPAVAVYGTRRHRRHACGPSPSPEERAWLGELGPPPGPAARRVGRAAHRHRPADHPRRRGRRGAGRGGAAAARRRGHAVRRRRVPGARPGRRRPAGQLARRTTG